MIVKNEAHVLPRTLPMLCKYFDFKYWVISDTGSTDGTQDLIRNFFKERGIPGELVETPWKNFGYNRSVAFEAAYNKTDYVLVWDADDGIEGTFKLPDKLDADAYEFEFGDPGGFRYSRLQLFNNRKRWKYVGVLHEYPAPLGTMGPIVHIAGDYYFVSGREGARNKDPDKYKKDASVLEAGLLEEPDNTRHMFYCANSYMNAGDPENAARMYKRVLASNAWSEEKYISCLHLFETAAKKGAPEEHLHYLVECNKYSPNRVEAITHLVRYYCAKDMHAVAAAYFSLVKGMYERGYNTAIIAKFLFARKQDYDYYLPYLMVIAATKIEDYKTAASMFSHICAQKYAGDAWHTRNLFFNFQFIKDIPAALPTLFNMLEYRDQLPADGFEEIQNKNIAAYIERCIPLLEQKPTQIPLLKPANAKGARILLTMPCTSVDRFKKTMYSLLNTWADLSDVDYMYCQKGRLSVKESKELRDAFPFIDFGVESPASIVRRVEPTYWIHLNDTCTFVRRDTYVKRTIDCLTKYEGDGLHQLLYNRGYAMTYADWSLSVDGCKEIEKGVLEHNPTAKNPWPHFALVPGCTRVAALTADVDVSSERAIGNEWNSKGYKTAYLNTICHITSAKYANPYLQAPEQIDFSVKNVATNMFVVNLERRPDRRADVDAKFKAAGVKDYCFVKAVDGKALMPTAEISRIFTGNNFNNRRGVIGCALSHYRLWQRLVKDETHKHYVIFEDDIDLCANFAAKMRTLTVDPSCDLLFLGFHTWDGATRYLPGADEPEPLNPADYAGGTFGYIITKQGAQKLCNYIEQHGCKYAIDWFMVKTTPGVVCKKMQPQWVLSEWMQTHASSVDSDIQRDSDSLDLTVSPEPVRNIKWRFIPGLDSFGNDIRCIGRKDIKDLLITASAEPGCIAVNTLGYLKNKVNTELIKPSCFGEGDGMFIREQ